MKKAFTLIELLVVIGIIGILTGILVGTFGRSTESARAARCLTNLKSLANAVQSYRMATADGSYPPVESSEYAKPYVGQGMAEATLRYYETPGWISWYSKDMYPADGATSSMKDSCRTISLYSTVVDDYRYALSHGALYKYVGRNASVYVCPSHSKKNPNVRWSYFMNPDYTANLKNVGKSEKTVDGDRVLLFAEIPFQGPGEWFPAGSGGTEATDAIIQYENENIGANHKVGGNWAAHVVFLDGHVEKLQASGAKGSVMSGSELRQLTEWLCKGSDVSYNGQAYEEVE